MIIKSFKDLDVWKRSHVLTLNIYQITKKFPDNERFGLVSQIRRSSASVSSNIVEGYRKSSKEFIRFLDISIASLEETKNHLILSKDLTYISEDNFSNLYDEAVEISRMITSLSKKIRAKLNK